MKLSASITIAVPRPEVFAFVSDVTNMPKWVSGVSSARMVSGNVGVGSRFVAEYRPSWRSDPIELEIVAYEPPTTFATRSSRGPFQFEGSVTLTESAEGTVVTNTIEAGPDSLSTKLATVVLGPLLRRSMRKKLLKELLDLERAVAA